MRVRCVICIGIGGFLFHQRETVSLLLVSRRITKETKGPGVKSHTSSKHLPMFPSLAKTRDIATFICNFHVYRYVVPPSDIKNSFFLPSTSPHCFCFLIIPLSFVSNPQPPKPISTQVSGKLSVTVADKCLFWVFLRSPPLFLILGQV